MWVILLLVASVTCESPLRPLPDKEAPKKCPTETPKKCPANEYYEPCPKKCPGTDGCSLLWIKIKCEPEEGCNLPPVCRCKPGLFRNSKGKCVTGKECTNPVTPAPEPFKCRGNETEVECKTVCPPRSCAISYTSYNCDKPITCERGCDCKKNYLRNSTGTCVFNEDCTGPPEVPPNIPIVCGYNEKPVDCVRTCPPEDCATLYFDYPCAYKEPNDCNRGCMCLDGHLRNSSGVCVPTKKCPPAPWVILDPLEPVCGVNETYVHCKQKCPPQSCNISYTTYDCTRVKPSCEPGCDCKKNYLRNKAGNCVLNNDCPPPPFNDDATTTTTPEAPKKCPANEYYEPCPKKCPGTDGCSLLWSKFKCEPEKGCNLPPVCRCKSGLFRNSKGKCVTGKECIVCGYNEKLVDCVRTCPPEDCAALYLNYLCAYKEPNDCDRGCMCLDGHLRNSSGVCIPTNECPPAPWVILDPLEPICGVNETYVDCKQKCPPQSCNISYTTYDCTRVKPSCEPGCDCKENYLRNKAGNCVLNNDCPPPPSNADESTPTVTTPAPFVTNCPPNEVKAMCKRLCPPQSCDAKYAIYECNIPLPCIPGCNCKDNFYRNKDGICIPSAQCPPPPGKVTTTPGPPVTLKPPNIHPPRPPPCRAVASAHASTTGSGSSTSSSSASCTPVKPPPPKKCPKNEIRVNCKVECQLNYCPKDDRQGLPICDPPHPCPSGCICQVGFRRVSSKNTSCIPSENCPPVKCTRPNEMWNPCPRPCFSERCRDVGKPPVICNTLIKDCQPQCVCKKGYFRNDCNICVPEKQCPPVPTTPRPTTTTEPPVQQCNANETYVPCTFDCPTIFCARNEYDSLIACSPPYPCRGGCICKESNHRRRSTKDRTCIPIEECLTPICGVNETFVDCVTSGCPNNYCPRTDSTAVIACAQSYPCPSGCMCKSGYRLRSFDDETCILIEECPPVTCSGKNEKWNVCPGPCLAESCAYADKPKPICLEKRRYCSPKCVCAKGYYRNESNVCVPASECPKPTTTEPPTTTAAPSGTECTGNQTIVYCPRFKCPHQFCSTTEKPEAVFCKPPRDCGEGCGCDVPYRYRSATDFSCVLAEDCPSVKCTKENEEWNKCPSLCLDESCKNANAPPSICEDTGHDCRPQCTCKKGYFRNDSGDCVPKEKCFEGTCPAGERWAPCAFDCPTDFCPRSESDTMVACGLPYNCSGGCVCQDFNDRRRSVENRTCISILDCPPIKCSNPNEVYNPCVTNCLAQTCEEALNPKPCTKEVKYCQPKCVCANGYYRDKNNVCVPIDKCPKPECTGNQTIVYCPRFKCPHQFCSTTEKPRPIACKPPRDCGEGCGCNVPYRYRSATDFSCVLAEDCPKVKCTKDNEEWNTCPSLCLDESCKNANAPPSICEDTGHDCRPQCTCKKGYFRNDSGDCVPKEKCFEGKCPTGETWAPCAFDCPTNFCPQSESDTMVACDAPYNCLGGCVCQDFNFRRRSLENRTCISIFQCPPITCGNPNEVYNPCVTDCLAQTCEEAANPKPCTKEMKYCQPKCVCADGYYRDENYVCVPVSQCPKTPTTETPVITTVSPPGEPCGVNETTVDCTFKCPHHFCPANDEGVIYACKPPRDCPSGCGCKLGYKYLSYDNLTCVLAEDCPPVECTRQNEEWDPCTSGCLDESCANADNPPVVCNELVHSCEPKCVCKKGFYKNDSGICVSKTECQKCKPNERYVRCKAGCPTDYCPTDDNRGMIACDPPYPCPGGCVCKLNYKYRSYNDPTCILASKCPPVNCTRQNELWSPCPSPCLNESCDSAFQPTKVCNYLVQNCQPRCICRKGFYRNDEDICVPAKKCPRKLQPVGTDV